MVVSRRCSERDIQAIGVWPSDIALRCDETFRLRVGKQEGRDVRAISQIQG